MGYDSVVRETAKVHPFGEVICAVARRNEMTGKSLVAGCTHSV